MGENVRSSLKRWADEWKITRASKEFCLMGFLIHSKNKTAIVNIDFRMIKSICTLNHTVSGGF